MLLYLFNIVFFFFFRICFALSPEEANKSSKHVEEQPSPHAFHHLRGGILPVSFVSQHNILSVCVILFMYLCIWVNILVFVLINLLTFIYLCQCVINGYRGSPFLLFYSFWELIPHALSISQYPSLFLKSINYIHLRHLYNFH